MSGDIDTKKKILYENLSDPIIENDFKRNLFEKPCAIWSKTKDQCVVHYIELIGELLLFLLRSKNIYFKMFIFIFKQMDLQWFGTDDQCASITIDRFHQFLIQIYDVSSIIYSLFMLRTEWMLIVHQTHIMPTREVIDLCIIIILGLEANIKRLKWLK